MKNIFKIAVNTLVCAGLIATSIMGVSAASTNIAPNGKAFDCTNGEKLYDAEEGNISLNGIADGNSTTLWQLDGLGEKKDGVLVWEDGIYGGVNFDTTYTVNKVVIIVENGSRYTASKDAVKVEVTTDGKKWTEVKGAKYTFDGDFAADANYKVDTVTFDKTDATGVRVVFYEGNEKYCPKLADIEIYGEKATEAPVASDTKEDKTDSTVSEEDKTDSTVSEEDKTDSTASKEDKTDSTASKEDKTDSTASEETKTDNAEKNPDGGVESITLFVVIALAAVVTLTVSCKARRA